MERLSVIEAAERMGVSDQFLRIALQQEKFPFGTAIKLSSCRYTYYINPAAFEKFMNGELTCSYYASSQ